MQGSMSSSQQGMGQPSQGPSQGGMPPSSMGGPQGAPQQMGTTGQLGRIEGRGLQSPSINEIIQTDVVTVEPDTEITEVVEKMANEEVGSVIVLDDEHPIGVITDRSIALSLAESTDVSDRTAEDFASGEVVTGNTDMTVFDVLDQLEDNDIRRLPIVDEEGSLEGIVTLDDIFVLVNAEMDNATSVIESQSPRF